MKVNRIHISWGESDIYARATVDVPGLGEVEIVPSFSDVLLEQIKAEVMVSMKMKLGHVIKE